MRRIPMLRIRRVLSLDVLNCKQLFCILCDMKIKIIKMIKHPLAPTFLSLALLLAAILLAKAHFLLSLAFYIVALICVGLPVARDALRGLLRRDLLDEKFLMCIASVGAMCIGEYTEAVAVMLFYSVGEYFQERAVRKARTSIRSLMEICPDSATVLTEDGEEVVDAEDVAVGARILLRTGDRVPLDARVLEGSADIDTSALTGESRPRAVSVSDLVDSGSVVLSGVLVAEAVRPAEESAAARILALVENASENKSKEENFITKFAVWYTPLVVGVAVLLAVVPPMLRLSSFVECLRRALLFLVVSCPCALVISVPMAFFGGIGGAARQGVLFKGGNVFSPLAKATHFVFDKTGTLTRGELAVIRAVAYEGTEAELLSLAAAVEHGSSHPVAVCLRGAALPTEHAENVRELAGRGMVATVGGSEVFIGNPRLMREKGIPLAEGFDEGCGAVLVAKDGRLLGEIHLADALKPEANAVMGELRSLGAKSLQMLSGDAEDAVFSAAKALALDGFRASLRPEDKYAVLEELLASEKNKVVFVGDGINDSPSLARADVGIAMGHRATDSAMEASDIVIMSDSLTRLPIAVRIAKRTVRIAKQNIVFALGVKLSVLLLGAFGLASMWWGVFADVGVAVLAILNSMRTLRKEKE